MIIRLLPLNFQTLAGTGHSQYNYDHKRDKKSFATERNTLGTRTNTITINGKIYDATTGKPLHTAAMISKKATPNPSSRKVISVVSDEQKPQPIVKKTVSRTKAVKSSNVHSHAQSSKTLMRTAVRRPSASETGKTAIVTSGLLRQPEHRVFNQPKTKDHHASPIVRSNKIHRFGPTASTTVQRSTKAIPVQSAPKHRDSATAASSVFALKQAPPIRTRTQKSGSNVLQNALSNASSHQTVTIGRKKTRTSKHMVVRIGASLAVIALLVGFFGYSAVPELSIRTASRQVGFSAGIPSYKPIGFSLNRSVEHTNGMVKISYISNTDNRYYTMTQSKYQDNQEGLNQQTLESGTSNYQIEEVKGLKIYIRNDGTQASWVNKGVWYTIEGTANLSNFQFTKIASSLN